MVTVDIIMISNSCPVGMLAQRCLIYLQPQPLTPTSHLVIHAPACTHKQEQQSEPIQVHG